MSDQFIGQTLADKYQIDSVLRDGGGLGKFYRATHVSMEKPVTVKILAPALAVDENIVKSFSREARTVSNIAHQNILNVTDFGADRAGATYIVFEGADGDSLKNTIARAGTLEFERAARIARQIAAALSAAHSNKVIHRQLNSGNVLLTRTANGAEIVKVMDFGAAETEEENDLDGALSIKKLEYLSPEQNSSVAEADARSDIYSLGVIFYEMLAGEVPFAADNSMDLLLKQANNPPAPLSVFRKDLPPAVEPVILKALAKNPDMRHQTAAEFVQDLNGATGNDNEAETLVLPAALKTDENIKNNLWKTAFVVLAGISLLAIGLIYATQSKQTDPATVLQTDANGQPVQPLNPATGMQEQGAANMMTYSPEQMMLGANSNMLLTRPDTLPPTGDGFGDGYNPWDRGVPPPGAPPPAGSGYYIDPTNPNGSIFMQDGTGGIVLVPVPVNANVVAPTANANVRTPSANANVRPTNTAPAANVAAPPTNTAPTTKPQPSPPARVPTAPAPKPTPAPPTRTPPAADRSAQSGREQDSQ